MRTIRLAAGALAAGTLLAACEGANPLQLEPDAAPAFSRGGTPDSAALAKVGITWQVVNIAEPAAPDVQVGDTLQLAWTVRFNDATVPQKPVQWTSSDTSVVSTPMKGLVIGRRSGTALLTASLAWRGLVHRDTVRITVADTVVAEAPATPPVSDAPEAPEGPDALEAPDTPDASDAPVSNAPLAAAQPASTAPALPRATVDTRMPTPTGRTINVRAGDNLQAALDAAMPGDVLLLQNGATFEGRFLLRPKKGNGWVVIRPASMAGLPQPGTRVTPAHAAAMPKIVMKGSNEGAIRALAGAGYYRLVGLEITATPSVRDFNALVRLHVDKAKLLEQVPHHIVFDRTYIHGQPEQAVTRCILMNSASTAVVDSYLSECHAKGRDSQAIAAWSGPGPFLIENNYLEGAGENVMFGGAKAESPEMVPSDIVIRGNHFFKPLAWRESRKWTVKNLLEIKQGQRVLIENNVLENNWVDAQTGRALLIRAADQGSSPWSRTNDITVRYNIIRNTPSVVSIDGEGPVETTRRVLVTQNLFYDIGDRSLGRGGSMFQLTGRSMRDIAIHQNTALFSSGDRTSRVYAVMLDRGPHERVAITNNVFELGAYGIRGSGALSGSASIARYAPGATTGGNIFIGSGSSSRYATLGRVVRSLDALDLAPDGTSTGPSVSALRLTSGAAAGADMAQVRARTARAVVR